MEKQSVENTVRELLEKSHDMVLFGKPKSFKYWDLILSVKDSLVFSIGEEHGCEIITLFQKKFTSVDIPEIISWCEGKLKILEEESAKLKELGFRQFRHGEFELDGNEFFLNLSRDIFGQTCLGEGCEIGNMSVVFNGMGYAFDATGSLTDVLKQFLRKNVPYDDFILLPQNLRDFSMEN